MCLVDLVHVMARRDAVADPRDDDRLLMIQGSRQVVGLREVAHRCVVFSLIRIYFSAAHLLLDETWDNVLLWHTSCICWMMHGILAYFEGEMVK